jgi:hypothetical protein
VISLIIVTSIYVCKKQEKTCKPASAFEKGRSKSKQAEIEEKEEEKENARSIQKPDAPGPRKERSDSIPV